VKIGISYASNKRGRSRYKFSPFNFQMGCAI
jgi:hypothetical protein